MKLERVQALKLPYGDCVYGVLGTRRGLFLSDSDRYMCRMDPDDYSVSWEIPWRGLTWMKIVGDALIANNGGVVSGLNPDTGELRWEHKAQGWVERGEGRLMSFVESGYILIDSQTGAVDRHVTTPSFRGFPICILPQCAILRSDEPDQTLRAFDFDSQQIRWELSPRRHLGLGDGGKDFPICTGTSPDESIVLIEFGAHLMGVRVSDGAVLWHRKQPGQRMAMRRAPGLMFIIEDRDLVCYDIATGNLVWRKPPDEPHNNFYLACRETFRGFLVLGYGCKRLCLASPHDGTVHATYTGDVCPWTYVGSDEIIVVRNYGRMDLLALRDPLTPRRRSTKALAVSTPSTIERERRAELRRAKRPSPPPAPTIEVIAKIQTNCESSEIPLPVVGPDAVYVTVRTVSGSSGSIRKLARPSYEELWKTPPLTVEPKWTTGAQLVCGRWLPNHVEVLDTADGRSLWSAESQRGQSWAWRNLIVTSPYEVKEIRFLEPNTGRCERVIERPLPRICHVSGDLALVCAVRHSDASGLIFKYQTDQFAVVDLETGQMKWQRPIFERFPSEEGSLRIPELVGVGSRVAVVWASRCIAGIDLTTGDVAWEVSPGSTFRPYVARNRVWMAERNIVRSIDMDTGEVTVITGRADGPDPCVIWGEHAVSFTTTNIDLYHLDGTSMRLKLRNGARTAIETSPDLILVEPIHLRIIRQVPPQ